MTSNETTSTGSGGRRYEKIIDLLAYAVENKVYGPVDRMARALSLDSVKIALYEAIRYATSGKEREGEGALDVKGLYKEIDSFLNELRPGLAKARDIALKALAKGLEAQRKKAEAQAGEAKEAEKTQRS